MVTRKHRPAQKYRLSILKVMCMTVIIAYDETQYISV